MIHQPPEWCYLHCKPCRASLITTVTFWELTAVKGLAWQLWATAGRTRPRWCHRPDQLSSVASRSQKSPKTSIEHFLRMIYSWHVIIKSPCKYFHTPSYTVADCSISKSNFSSWLKGMHLESVVRNKLQLLTLFQVNLTTCQLILAKFQNETMRAVVYPSLGTK